MNNLSLRQGDAGDRAGALASATEAVGYYRQLEQSEPGTFLFSLAISLHNLQKAQREVGDQVGALASVTEAVGYYRQLALSEPDALRPDLALSLRNLSLLQAEVGDRVGALASVTEAVGYYRELAEAESAVFLSDLAASLKILSLCQAQAGDRVGALASVTEAIGYYRELVQADLDTFLPELATSLNILSQYQAEAADRADLMITITEAIGYYRRLAEADPATFLPDLAMLLNNLSNTRVGAGDRAGALDTITEAVGHYRRLAEADPATFLPKFATSLNVLSLCQAEVEDRAGALATITEAVAICRELAEADPAAFLPDLALSLNNLSNRQAEAGDQAGALLNITEAVNIRRRLAQADQAFLPVLAGSLNNLSLCQAAVEDRAGALATITEAVAICRRLAEADPAAFLPRLIASLYNLSNRLFQNGRARAVAQAWRVAIGGMTSQGARAELRAAWASWLLEIGSTRKGRKELRRAATEADHAPADDSTIVITRARQAVRSAIQAHGPADSDDLPLWATAPIPDSHVELVDTVRQAGDWPALHAALDRHRDVLSSPQLRISLYALAGLYPTNPAPGMLLGLLDEIDASGLDALIHRRQQAHERRVLLGAWIATPTWAQSLEFFRQHHAELTTGESRQTLADASDDDTVRQHLAILDLAQMTSVDEAYAVVTDLAAAEDAAFAAIEDGDLPLLAVIAAAAPALQDRPTTWGLLMAILLLAEDDEDSAYAHMRQVAEQGGPMLRRAHAMRLRALQRHHPDLPGLDRLIDIIDSERASG